MQGHGNRFVFRRDVETGKLVGPGGCHYDTEAEAMYYDVLDGCGCGDPEAVHAFAIECVQQFAEGGGRKLGGVLDAVKADPESAAELIAHVLTNANLLEHGSSARCSWVTELGKQFIELGPFLDTCDADLT